MTRRSVAMFGALLGAAAVALSCGEVPTLPEGIAYYSPVLLPSPAVAVGDTLRDSLGIAAPLRVRAFGRDSQEITDFTVLFVPSVLPTLISIDSTTGLVVARDTAVGSVQLVGRIGDRLQTTLATLLVVPQPQSISRPAGAESGDSATTLPLKALPVTVTGTFKGASTPVNGIIVRYRIDSLLPAGTPRGSALLSNASGVTLRSDSTLAVDTTKSAGNATSSVLVLPGNGVQKVFVSASARRLDGLPLQGSPVRFVLELKPQP